MFSKICVLTATLCVLQVIKINAEDPTGTYCSGHRQSPIDINTKRMAKAEMPGIKMIGYEVTPLTQKIMSDKHSIVILSTFETTPFVTGGPLDDIYNLHSIHFHWSNENDKGSEHLINGKPYPMEMHVVHTKDGLTFEEAKAQSDGLVVLGYFCDVNLSPPTGNPDNSAFGYLTNTMATLTAPMDTTDMIKLIPISKIAIPFEYKFIHYLGSLTTNNCDESVLWLISPKLLKLTEGQMDIFRSLKEKHIVEEASNYRSPQPLNGRDVYYVPNPLQA